MRIYIYGAGRVGRLLEELLFENGYHVEAFIDVNAENLHYKEYTIMQPEVLRCSEDVQIIVALAMENAANSAKSFLESLGYKNVVLWSDKKIQDKLCVCRQGGGRGKMCTMHICCMLLQESEWHRKNAIEFIVC